MEQNRRALLAFDRLVWRNNWLTSAAGTPPGGHSLSEILHRFAEPSSYESQIRRATHLHLAWQRQCLDEISNRPIRCCSPCPPPSAPTAITMLMVGCRVAYAFDVLVARASGEESGALLGWLEPASAGLTATRPCVIDLRRLIHQRRHSAGRPALPALHKSRPAGSRRRRGARRCGAPDWAGSRRAVPPRVRSDLGPICRRHAALAASAPNSPSGPHSAMSR